MSGTNLIQTAVLVRLSSNADGDVAAIDGITGVI
jgi:hypothetical protein